MRTNSAFRSASRRLSAAAAVASIGIVGAASADAHVHVTPEKAAAGSYSVLTFKVPNESKTASTTKVEVTLPTDHPLSSVSYQPVPGWTAKVTTSKLPKPVTADGKTLTQAPTKIEWTADANSGIKDGQFHQFVISAGPLPSVDSITLPTKQTYSDGHVVNWNQPIKGSEEPESPAPILYINGAAPSADSHAAPADSKHSAAVAANDSSDASDSTARWIGVGGLAAGLLGLLVAVVAMTRRGQK